MAEYVSPGPAEVPVAEENAPEALKYVITVNLSPAAGTKPLYGERFSVPASVGVPLEMI
jgi:hypothetical protein